MEFLYFLGAVVALIVAYLVANEFADIAEEKGHTRSRYFWFTFLLGIPGMLMVIALPNKMGVNLGTNQENTYKQQNKQTVERMDAPKAETSSIKWRCNVCGNMRSQTPCEYCEGTVKKSKAPYQCGKCGHEGPYDGNCPACGSSLKFYNH